MPPSSRRDVTKSPAIKCRLRSTVSFWRQNLNRCIEEMYTIHMKRTNLVLDAELLDQVTRALGVKTYSAAVNLALAEVLRVRKIQTLPRFFGQGLWQGDLREMREDRIAGRHTGNGRSRGRR